MPGVTPERQKQRRSPLPVLVFLFSIIIIIIIITIKKILVLSLRRRRDCQDHPHLPRELPVRGGPGDTVPDCPGCRALCGCPQADLGEKAGPAGKARAQRSRRALSSRPAPELCAHTPRGPAHRPGPAGREGLSHSPPVIGLRTPAAAARGLLPRPSPL